MSTNQDPGDLDIVLVELQIGKLHSWLVDRKHIKLSSISATPAFESRRQAAIAAALKEIGSEDTKRGELGEIGELGELGEIGEIGDYWDAFELVQELQRQFPDEEQRKPAAAALATAANAIGQLMMQLTSSSPACSSSQPKHLFVNKTLAELWDVVCVWWVDKGLHFAETAAVLARNALFEM